MPKQKRKPPTSPSRDLLSRSNRVAAMADWELWRAMGVSADGRVVVGYGTNPDGNTEAWRAVVPEPSSIALLGLLAYARRSRRNRL